MSKPDIEQFDKNQKLDRNEAEVKLLNAQYENIANKLLSIYGPEGAYDISDKLKEFADKDVAQSVEESVKSI